MIEIINKTKSLTSSVLNRIRRNAEYFWDRLKGFIGIHPVDSGIVYTENEKKTIECSAEALRIMFPISPGQVLLGEDFESRCEAIEDFGNMLIDLYALDGTQIIITDDDSIFNNDGRLCFGYAVFQHPGTVYINANILKTDDAIMLEHVVSTMIHELRHIMQFQIMTLRNTHQVPYSRRTLWRYNVKHYIDASEDFEGYQKQPLEWDARNFTNRVWQQSYNKAIS